MEAFKKKSAKSHFQKDYVHLETCVSMQVNGTTASKAFVCF